MKSHTSKKPKVASGKDGWPAGHASAGNAWMFLYFFLDMIRPSLRGWGLSMGIALGLLFGVSQQLRGAHLISHDMSSAAICWFGALMLYLLWQRGGVEARVAGEAVG